MTTQKDMLDLRELRVIDGTQGTLPPEQHRIYTEDVVGVLEEDQAQSKVKIPKEEEEVKKEEENEEMKGNMLD